MLNKAPPAKHRTTFIMVESSGVIDGTIISSSKPTAREPTIENHSFCLPTVLMMSELIPELSPLMDSPTCQVFVMGSISATVSTPVTGSTDVDPPTLVVITSTNTGITTAIPTMI